MKFLYLGGGIIIGIIFLVFIEAYIAAQVKLAPFSNPSAKPLLFGSHGTSITYVVLGDSTAAGQGAEYTQGIAVKTAEHLAENHRVRLINLAFSGAQLKDVLIKQLPQLMFIKPDVVLLSAGANDVTHLTSLSEIRTDLTDIIETLYGKNCHVRMVITGSPAMDTTLLFAQPLRFLAGFQSDRVNTIIDEVIAYHHMTKSPIADKTGPFFAKDKTLFASDRFHPNEKGYTIWTNVLNESLDSALITTPRLCD